jgi:hypothetical protein
MWSARIFRSAWVCGVKWENLWLAYCLWFAYSNFCRIHQTLRIAPAMAAGITSEVWDLEILSLRRW